MTTAELDDTDREALTRRRNKLLAAALAGAALGAMACNPTACFSPADAGPELGVDAGEDAGETDGG